MKAGRNCHNQAMKNEDIDREITTKEIDIPPYLSNFSSFGLLDVKLPEGFRDVSCAGEDCPRFHHAATGMGVWVNFKRVDDRREQVKDKPRFRVYASKDKDGNPVAEKPGRIVLETDDWQAVLAFVRQ